MVTVDEIKYLYAYFLDRGKGSIVRRYGLQFVSYDKLEKWWHQYKIVSNLPRRINKSKGLF